MPAPALPVGGALLLGAFLLWRGAVLARGRDTHSHVFIRAEQVSLSNPRLRLHIGS